MDKKEYYEKFIERRKPCKTPVVQTVAPLESEIKVADEELTNAIDALDRDQLKKIATEKGIEFKKNIKTDKLKELIKI